MARSDTGKWVARAAATGGGKTYRGQRPLKWYGSLTLICLLGLSLIWYSRYERQHPSSNGQPTTGTKWVSALSFDVCGVQTPNVPANPKAKATPQLSTTGDGLIRISPSSDANAGGNATLGRFVSLYPGMLLTSSSVRVPGKGSSTVGRTWRTGDRCPKGTPDADKQGNVIVQVYTTFTAKKPIIVDQPDAYRLGNNQLITVAFVPHGASIPKPPGTVVSAMLTASEAASSPTTTVPTLTPPVSVPATSPTTAAPGSSTTVASSPTTTTG